MIKIFAAIYIAINIFSNGRVKIGVTVRLGKSLEAAPDIVPSDENFRTMLRLFHTSRGLVLSSLFAHRSGLTFMLFRCSGCWAGDTIHHQSKHVTGYCSVR